MDLASRLLSHAVAVRRSAGDLKFEQTDDPYQWALPTGKLELVHIEEIYVATAQFTGGRWLIIDEDYNRNWGRSCSA